MKLSVNKYVTCTHNALIRQGSICKMLLGLDNGHVSIVTLKRNVSPIELCLRVNWCESQYVQFLEENVTVLFCKKVSKKAKIRNLQIQIPHLMGK